MKQHKIRISGKPRTELDLDLLAEAIVIITEQQLQDRQPRPDEAAS